MMKKIILALSCIATLFLAQLSFAFEDKIVAIVNDKPITKLDVLQFRKMLMLLNKISVMTPQLEAELNKVALDSIINQSLIQEQKNIFKIKISKEEIQGTIDNAEHTNNLPHGFFKKLFQENNANYKVFENKIESDIAFRKITNQAFMNIIVNKEEVENAIIAGNMKKAELGLKIFSSKQLDNQTLTAMTKLSNKLNNCDKLPKKQEYERFASLEEVTESINNLPPFLKSTAQSLQKNQASSVIKTDDSFKIIMVCERKIDEISEQESNFLTNSIGNIKINKQAQRFYTNLRKKAYINILGF